MEVFKIIYTVLGGLGVFFYGMKSMSEALQSVAGDMIKNIINTLTKNRVSALLVGIVVTMLVQSSSVTTVMVVGFVNAGLMQLSQAIGIVFGANIGTTITGWIISIKVGKYGLLFIGLGIFPMLFGKSNRVRQIGRITFGIGMIFFGLDLMSDAFKPLRKMPEFLKAISYFSDQHYGAYIASIVVGCLLTVIIQSSSAMLGITMALAMSGVIQFHTAAALVLGENIGTTITALLASVGGNIEAKRTARAHAFFNLLGVLVIFMIFPYYVQFIDWVIPGDPSFVNEKGEYSNIAVHIASGHTIFNVTSALIFLPFVKTLAAFITRITPDKGVKEQTHLVMLGDPSSIVPATALTTARVELNKMKDIVDRSFALTERVLKGEIKDRLEVNEAIAKIQHYEDVCDNIQKEITLFVLKLLERPMDTNQSDDAHSITRVTDELESISDYLANIAKYSKRIPLDVLLDDEAGADFFSLFLKVKEYYASIGHALVELKPIDLEAVMLESEELRKEANVIRGRHLERVGEGSYEPMTALTYSDLIVSLRKIRSHSQSMAEGHQHSMRSS
jgi:phosphate:Na+ symporter